MTRFHTLMIGAALGALTMTIAPSPALAITASQTGTLCAGDFLDFGGSNAVVVLVMHQDRLEVASVLELLPAEPAAIPGSGLRQAFRPIQSKERRSLAAVRPTSAAGWRSGRLRHLAA